MKQALSTLEGMTIVLGSGCPELINVDGYSTLIGNGALLEIAKNSYVKFTVANKTGGTTGTSKGAFKVTFYIS